MKKQVHIMIDPEIKIMLDVLCKKDQRSQAIFISRLIKQEYKGRMDNMNKLTVKMLTDNIDGNCRVILLRDNFEIYNDRSCNLSENLKEMEVNTFKYNHDLKFWELKVRRK